MAQQSLDLKISGLFLYGSEFSEAPQGALSVADNIVINRPSVAEPRRGFDRLATGFLDATTRANKLFFYQNQLLAHYSSASLARYVSGTWTDYSGTYAPPSSSVKVRACEANQNFYFTTASGVYKLDSYLNTPTLSGTFKGLDMQASLPGSATYAWLPNNYRVAYRLVWGYTDANNNLILGAASQRESIKNTSGSSKDVSLTFTIPAGVTTNYIYQIYRSPMIDISVVDSEPSDEMVLVYQGSPASADISALTVTVRDIVDDSLRVGATIYTAASQEGIANQNERPPLCKDVATYKGITFYGNTVSKQRYYLTLLAVGGTSGISSGDTITIGGVTYTGAASETISSRQFAVATTGSVSQQIHDTAVSLIRVVNRSSSSTVYGYYLSGPTDLPGKILFEERGIGGGTFALTSSRSTCWNTSLPSSGTAQSSTADTFKNGAYYSKFQEPEAVPIGNYLKIGSADKNILRVLPLRSSLFFLKEDGVYRVSGENAASFRVDLLDSTAILIAPDSAVVLNNEIYALTSQGVVTITETGVSVVSRPIEATLLSLQGRNLSVLQNQSFAVSYESERKYILFVPSTSGDTTPTQAYVYNTFTNAWTRWPLARTCGVVAQATDKLYLGDANSAYVNIERKTFSYQDYVDYGFTSVITAVSGRTLTMHSVDSVSVGDVIYQSSTAFSTVASVDTVLGTVTTSITAGFSTGATDVLKAITSTIAWIPFTYSNPGILKQIWQAIIIFKSDFTGTGSLTFSTDVSRSTEAETFTGTPLGLWGLFPWGGVPWGGQNQRRPYRVIIPRNKQRATQLTVQFQTSTGYSAYQLAGISLTGNLDSEKVANG